MDRDRRRAGRGERPEMAIRLDDHQVHIDRQRCRAPDGPRYRGPHRDLGDEPPIHDVDVDPRRARAFGGAHFLGQAAHVGGKNRRRDLDRPGSGRGATADVPGAIDVGARGPAMTDASGAPPGQGRISWMSRLSM
jgi:hypothetical protein